jgi:hypothetical protein
MDLFEKDVRKFINSYVFFAWLNIAKGKKFLPVFHFQIKYLLSFDPAITIPGLPFANQLIKRARLASTAFKRTIV